MFRECTGFVWVDTLATIEKVAVKVLKNDDPVPKDLIFSDFQLYSISTLTLSE